MKKGPYTTIITGVTVTMLTHKTNPDMTGDSIFNCKIIKMGL